MARVAGDMNDVGVARGFVFARCEYAEGTHFIVLDSTERTPLAMTLLARRREERHLILCLFV